MWLRIFRVQQVRLTTMLLLLLRAQLLLLLLHLISCLPLPQQ
jgi:hypothetical protein